jgi:HK97 gp10 family phage protein
MIVIEGMQDLQRLFKLLPNRVDTKVTRAVARRGGREVVKAARKTTPVGPGNKKWKPGNLKRSIQVILPKNRKDYGVLVGAKARQNEAKNSQGFHAHFVGLGTAKRRTQKGANRGKMPAHGQWIKKAAASSQTQVFAAMKNAATPLLEREMVRLSRRGMF